MKEYKVTKEKIDSNSFIVCLLAVPDFPHDNDHRMGIVRTPLRAVIGAVYEPTESWSFTLLTKEEKHIIGDALINLNAEIGEWFWCTQYE